MVALLRRTHALAALEYDDQCKVGSTAYTESCAFVHTLSLLNISLSGHEEKPLFHNLGNGKFVEIGGALGVAATQDGRGLAAADLFSRGAVDLLLGTAYKPPLICYVNQVGTNKNMLTLRLRGKSKNTFAIGARVLFETETLKQAQEMECGGSFLSCNPPELYFGMADSKTVKKVTIDWPSGKKTTTTLADVPAGIVTVTEGEEGWKHEPYRKAPKLEPKRVRPLRQGDEVTFDLESLTGEGLLAASWKDRWTVLSVWSSRCTSCVSELKLIPELLAATEKLGVRFVSVNVDDDTKKAQELVKSLPRPIFVWRIDDVDKLLNPKEPLVPATFLVGPDGKVVTRTVGVMTAKEIEAMVNAARK